MRILSHEQIKRVDSEAMKLLGSLGVIFDCDEALDVMAKAGATVDRDTKKVCFPEEMVRKAIETAPDSFDMYDREGNFYCRFGDGKTRYNPGSSALNVLDEDGRTSRLSGVKDLIKITRVAEKLPEIDFVSSSVACIEAPGQLGSQYLYYAEMQNSTKPIIGGSTDEEGVPRTVELLKAVQGDEKTIKEKPYTIFDICVTSPFKWSKIGARNIIDCVRYGIPIEMISAMIAGATGPVTLAGCILQHTVEMLSGLVLIQTLNPGHPTVYGGAPCVFNMKTAYTPMEAMESTMITLGYVQMGKHYGLPTHTYAAMSDAKETDYQAGSETARSGLLCWQAGVDNISGPGGLNVIAEMSAEKLVLDSDFIGTVRHLEKGINFNDETLASEAIMSAGAGGSFMTSKHTRKNYRKELNYGNIAMNYNTRSNWEKEGMLSVEETARKYVADACRQNPCELSPEKKKTLDAAFARVCADAGLSDEQTTELIEKYEEV